jgi:hypothetical protein
VLQVAATVVKAPETLAGGKIFAFVKAFGDRRRPEGGKDFRVFLKDNRRNRLKK